MSTLVIAQLRDPSPPIPTAAQRAAVAVRARALQHRRRLTQLGAVAAVAAVAITGVAIAAAVDTTSAPRIVAAPASVSGATTSTPTATLVVTFIASDGTKYVVDADALGVFALSDLPPGHYDVTWAYEQEGIDPSSDIQIGSATAVGRTAVELGSGLNIVRIPLPQ